MTENFEKKFCLKCENPKNDLVNGKEFFLRCECDVKRGIQDRIKKTLHKEFLELNIKDWNPAIFKDPSCLFQDYLSAQGIVMIFRLWEYAYKRYPDNLYALEKSIQNNKSLFIRGPRNSGKGLLMASVKIVAAMRDLSITPLPADFDVFKNDLSATESFGKTGEEFKFNATEAYGSVKILAIENFKAETQYQINGNKTPKKFKGAGAIDNLIAGRCGKQGTIVLTSYDFIGQVLDTLGERLFDTLIDDKMSLILLLSVSEINSLINSLNQTHLKFIKYCKDFAGSSDKIKPKKENTLSDQINEDNKEKYITDAIYFEEVFKKLPNLGAKKQDSIIQDIEDGLIKSQYILDLYNKFINDKSQKNLSYIENCKRIQIESIKECKDLSQKLTEKEMLEIGKITSLATDIDRKKELREKALEYREKMSGELDYE